MHFIRKVNFYVPFLILSHKGSFASAFAVPRGRLLAFDVMLQRLKFPANERVHICIDLLVSACRFG